MGASVSIRVPSWQRIDTFQSQRQFANLETRNELKRRLITFNIEDLTSALRPATTFYPLGQNEILIDCDLRSPAGGTQ
jgi:hypothetical protein